MGLVDRMYRLSSAVLADVLDSNGHREQTMSPELVRLGATHMVVGRASTLDVVAVDEVPEDLYKVQFEAVDHLIPGSVMVVSAPPVPSAFWGELLTTGSEANGCVGAIVDGYTRDLSGILTHEGFGLWARGTHPADSAGRLDGISFGEDISCGGVQVRQGDYVIADLDGVVVLPAEVAESVVEAAELKASAESKVRDALTAGASVTETYSRFGVM